MELLRQMPVLPRLKEDDLTALLEQLRSVVFPGRSRTRKEYAKDQSDLTHLAYCIHYRLTGFVTSEQALLRAGQEIKRQFALDVLSPFEFLDPQFESPAPLSITTETGTNDVEIRPFEERDRASAEAFIDRIGITSQERQLALQPGTGGSTRRRLIARVNGELVAFASWSVPRKLVPESQFFLFSDEQLPLAERIVEHLLETVSRERSATKVYGVTLIHGPGQSLTRRIAIDRGFRSRVAGVGSSKSLFKVSVSGLITETNWASFGARLKTLVGVELPPQMPTYEQVTRSGVSLRGIQKHWAPALKLFEFETLMSPGVFLYSGRAGLLVPIRQRYAEELLGEVKQKALLPSGEALLRIEKAYFRSLRSAGAFAKGILIVFYVSGHGGGSMQAVGSARITSSALMRAKEAFVLYSRQGVLREEELARIADQHGLHVVTFDNFSWFYQPIDYKRLKELGCIGGANLITAQRLEYDCMLHLLTEGFAE